MGFSILEFLGLKKKRSSLPNEQTERKPFESDADPIGGDNDDGFGGEGDGGDGE